MKYTWYILHDEMTARDGHDRLKGAVEVAMIIGVEYDEENGEKCSGENNEQCKKNFVVTRKEICVCGIN